MLMNIAEVYRAAFLDFKRDYEPENQREIEAFIEGFRSGINATVSCILKEEMGGDKKDGKRY